ncbi:MAG: DNA-binding transcriptional regulator KdgR [Candidatus Roseilinea sp.]|nr:MAG: DNA-binding transcriptional regulator KdgR [Candidatus Roseilinea sp.]
MSEIQSVRRAFDILAALSCEEGASLSEIVARVALPKSTVSRMLSTLEAVGAVERQGDRDGFRIGQTLISLVSNAPYARSLVAVARPFLQGLAEATGETLTLCVPDGDYARYVDQIDTARALQVRNWVGQRLPLHACSDGKLYLAHRDPAQVERYLMRPLQRFTPTTLASAAALRRELRAIRRKGYAWTNGEFDPDIVGVAAPIYDEAGHIVASVCLFGPAFRWPSEQDADHFIQLTKDTAGAISAKLGYFSTKVAKKHDVGLNSLRVLRG